MATETEIAWLAGIIEGEGCIYISPKSVAISVSMTDRDIIDRLDALFPSPGISLKQQRRPDGTLYKPQYVWRTRKADQVREILNLVMPWLGGRRKAKALAALEHLDSRRGQGYGRLKTHCAEGHQFTPENTYLDPDTGYRNCRACRRRWAQEARDRKGPDWKWRGQPRTCDFCGSEFRPSTPKQRTCDRACGSKLRWQRARLTAK